MSSMPEITIVYSPCSVSTEVLHYKPPAKTNISPNLLAGKEVILRARPKAVVLGAMARAFLYITA